MLRVAGRLARGHRGSGSFDPKELWVAASVFPIDDPMVGAVVAAIGKTPDDVLAVFHFLKKSARDHHDTGRVRVYLALHKGALVGFYTLVVSSQAAIAISPEADKKFERVKVAPLVYLSMVGVDGVAKGCGIGKLLMGHTMRTTLRIADLAGVYALSLDARDQDVSKFYEALGFAYFTVGALRMYYPVREIRQALVNVK